MSSARRRALFFDGGRWSEDGRGANIRIESSLDLAPKVRNQVYLRDENGWGPIPDDGRLSPAQQGLWFEVSPAVRGARKLLAFRCARFVDEAMLKGPLKGLRILDDLGQPMEDPLRCGDRFLLTPEDGKILADAVKEAGGALARGAVPAERRAAQVASLESELDSLTALLDSDLDFLDEVGQNNFSGQLAFDERGRDLRNRGADLKQRIGELEGRLDHEIEAETQSDTRAALMQLSDRLQAVGDSVDELRQARSRAEHLLSRKLAGGSPVSKMPSVARQLLIRDLERLAHEQGLASEDAEGGVVICLPEGRLVVDENGLRLAG